MTQQDIFNAWTRYMHRNDLSQDNTSTWTFAGQMITNRLMHSPVDLTVIEADHPQLYLHAGLTYLHELAMDDNGLAREEQRFTNALADYAMRYSLTTTPAPVMTPGVR
jgi:hypothetical protein